MPLMDHQRYMPVNPGQHASGGDYGTHQIGYRGGGDSDTTSEFGRISVQDRYGQFSNINFT